MLLSAKYHISNISSFHRVMQINVTEKHTHTHTHTHTQVSATELITPNNGHALVGYPTVKKQGNMKRLIKGRRGREREREGRERKRGREKEREGEGEREIERDRD